MLVVGLEASFQKKATGLTAFTCADGGMIARAVEEALATGESRQVKTESTGHNESGEVVAVFHITWSFRAKKA
jgi:inosine-uridine nucleoside N-ribohydrolase